MVVEDVRSKGLPLFVDEEAYGDEKYECAPYMRRRVAGIMLDVGRRQAGVRAALLSCTQVASLDKNKMRLLPDVVSPIGFLAKIQSFPNDAECICGKTRQQTNKSLPSLFYEEPVIIM